MPDMPERRHVLLAAVGGCTLGLVVAAAPWASAGHTNPVLTAELDGRQEVDPTNSRARVGDRNGSGEIYVFGIDGADNVDTICYVLTVDRIAETELAPGAPRAAHIHMGAAGTNGPVVVNLAWPQDGQAADCIAEDRVLPNGSPAFARANGAGVDQPPLVTAQQILADPHAFYVNVHNGEFPNGAVRGQLDSQADHQH
jgi:hypothetical protein